MNWRKKRGFSRPALPNFCVLPCFEVSFEVIDFSVRRKGILHFLVNDTTSSGKLCWKAYDRKVTLSYKRFPLESILEVQVLASHSKWEAKWHQRNGAYGAVTAAQPTGRGWTSHFNHIFGQRPCSCGLVLCLHINLFLHLKTSDSGPERAFPPATRGKHSPDGAEQVNCPCERLSRFLLTC